MTGPNKTLEYSASALAAVLCLLWTFTSGTMTLRMVVMCAIILLALFYSFKNTSWDHWYDALWKKLVLLLIAHTALSAAFGINPKQWEVWTNDYLFGLVLALSVAVLRPVLKLTWVVMSVFIGLILNGAIDLFQVVRYDDFLMWKGPFSDYAWQNGYLLLNVPIFWGIIPALRDNKPNDHTKLLVALAVIAGVLSHLALFSSWSRAVVMGLWGAALVMMIPTVLFGSWDFRKTIQAFGCAALVFAANVAYFFLPSNVWKYSVIRPIDTLFGAVFFWLLLLLIPEKWRFKAGVIIICIGFAGCIFAGSAMYKFGLKSSHSELVRSFAYREVVSDPSAVPVLGYGPGRDTVLMGKTNYVSRMEAEIMSKLKPESPLDHSLLPREGNGHTHVQWINWRYELGWLGLLLIASLLGIAGVHFVRGLLSGFALPWLAGFGAALVGFTLVALLNIFHSGNLAQQQWFFYGLFMSYPLGIKIKGSQ
ncbi:MAG: hypothetical protein SGI71_03195 [Verrucomicrobiota bacterium]|nr:hypothetical protein [Verrucomicrobiota bacterium]